MLTSTEGDGRRDGFEMDLKPETARTPRTESETRLCFVSDFTSIELSLPNFLELLVVSFCIYLFHVSYVSHVHYGANWL